MFVIPSNRLPPGFAERIETPPAEPAAPRPAATAVLLRDSAGGPETLLLERHRTSGFVPGAYVFPGGRVDEADADPGLLDLVDGLGSGTDPDPAFWIGVLREVFEETAVLIARDAAGRPAADATTDHVLADWRGALLAGRTTLRRILETAGLRLTVADVVYCAHWITPLVESRRYDTRFFLARLPDGAEVRTDPREMADAVWLRPADALERFHAGRLPMVFPTVATLEAIAGFRTTAEALDAFRGRPVSPILPRLVRTDDGVGIVIDGSSPP